MTPLENYLEGHATRVGSASLERADIVKFAQAYDPQRFHLDEQAAREMIFGGLCASGWHTCGLWMRAMVNWTQSHAPGAFIISPGFRDMRWPKPAYVDQTINAHSKVHSWRENQKREGSRILKTENWVEDDTGDRVMEFKGTLIFGP